MMSTGRICGFAVLAAICGSFVTGCSSPVEPPPNGLSGVWEWVRSEGGIAGATLTPATEGYTLQLRITRADRLQLDRDGVAEVVTRFELIPSSGKDRLRYDEPVLGQTEHAVMLSDGELILTDPCCDGFTHTWIKRAGGPTSEGR